MKEKNSFLIASEKKLLEINLTKGQAVYTKNYKTSLKEMKYVINGQITNIHGLENLVLR